MATKRRGASKTDPDVLVEIQDLVNKHPDISEPQIRERLEAKFPVNKVPTDVRTIRAAMKKLRPQDPGGPWDWRDDPEGSRPVLDVLSTLLELAKDDAMPIRLTNRHAEWIRDVRAVAPDLPSHTTWQVVLAYMWVTNNGVPTDHLDAFLAFAPWRGEEAQARFRVAREAGRIPEDDKRLSLERLSFERTPETRQLPPSYRGR